MKFTLVDQSTIEDLAYGWFNPPKISDVFSETHFFAEHRLFVDKLIQTLRTFGSVAVDPAGKDGEFILGYETDLTRSVFIVCFFPNVFSCDLVEAIAVLVDGCDPEYLVVIDGQFEDGRSFYLCINKGMSVLGWATDGIASLKIFGFPE